MNEVSMNKCQCNETKLCCKMQKSSLRMAISNLKDYQSRPDIVKDLLKTVISILKVYDCLPATCLIQRIQWTLDNIDAFTKGYNHFVIDEKLKLNMLISELEIFLRNMDN